jgi:Uncharacterized conserved protein, contains double-stranded beta-helix domain
MNDKTDEELKEKILDPAQLVSYQDGSVVSRMVVNKPTGTITIFAFDAGEGLSEHTAPYDAILTIIEGSAEITVAGKEYSLNRGQMIIMPARIPHGVRAVHRFKMLLTMIHD